MRAISGSDCIVAFAEGSFGVEVWPAMFKHKANTDPPYMMRIYHSGEVEPLMAGLCGLFIRQGYIWMTMRDWR